MNAGDVMTTAVVTVGPQAPVTEIVTLLLRHGISAVPVVDEAGAVLGLVSEGDLLRRAELGTQKQRSAWRAFFTGTAKLAEDYVRSHAKVADDVMTRDVVCVGPGTPLDTIADLMEQHRIKRVPVVQERRLVGIVSRANLLRAFAALPEGPCATASDAEIRTALTKELSQQAWSRRADNSVVVTGGVVHLWGMVTSQEESRALELAAQSVPGACGVENHTVVLSEKSYPMYLGSVAG
ncbi:MAG: CBS domain-containing protein [Alphaproteobacteria bacterium]|nr:CBS domain-containing protein [Alphaproteobacteria bacterium]